MVVGRRGNGCRSGTTLRAGWSRRRSVVCVAQTFCACGTRLGQSNLEMMIVLGRIERRRGVLAPRTWLVYGASSALIAYATTRTIAYAVSYAVSYVSTGGWESMPLVREDGQGQERTVAAGCAELLARRFDCWRLGWLRVCAQHTQRASTVVMQGGTRTAVEAEQTARAVRESRWAHAPSPVGWSSRTSSASGISSSTPSGWTSGRGAGRSTCRAVARRMGGTKA